MSGPGEPATRTGAGAGEAPGRATGGDRGGAWGTGSCQAAGGTGGLHPPAAAVATLSAVGAALLLLSRPAPPPAAAQAGPPAPAPVAATAPGPDEAGALAGAFEAGLEAGDAAAVLALFAPDAQIREGVAVLAAGPERVAAWVEGCLLPDVRLVPGTRRLGAAAAAWELRDALGCYWRARPDGFRPAWDVAPGEGTLTVAVAGARIATLTVVYRPAWEARRLTAQAAPFRTAQARATAAAPAPAGATPPPAARPVPAAPGPQDRRTPSVAPWLAALGAALGGGGLLALLPRPREAP